MPVKYYLGLWEYSLSLVRYLILCREQITVPEDFGLNSFGEMKMKMKMKRVILPIIVSVIYGSAFADESAHYDENGHRYERIDKKRTWDDAEEYCRDSGGYLATVTSRDESDFIYRKLADGISSSMWLGGTDRDHEGTWQWVTDEVWDYERWSSRGANDKGQGQDYLSFNSGHSRRWEDNGLPRHDERKKFICEYEHSSSGDCEVSYSDGRLIIFTDLDTLLR